MKLPNATGILLFLGASALLPASLTEGQRAAIDQATGAKGVYTEAEDTYKVTFPRTPGPDQAEEQGGFGGSAAVQVWRSGGWTPAAIRKNYEHLASEDRHGWDRAIMEYLKHANRRKPMS